MELGVYSFGDLGHDRTSKAAGRRLDALIRQAQAADEAGLDMFALGEHHRPDFAVSAPEVVLAAIAATTRRIRLTTSVIVLSTVDPVRLMEQFGTLDQISHGRTEITVGRGAFPESYSLFGYDIRDYEALFDENVRLLIQLRDDPAKPWQGRFRSALRDVHTGPRPAQQKLPIWIGVGGTPQSAVRAGMLGQPMFLSLFAGPRSGVRLVELYRRAGTQAGHDPASLRLATGGHMYVGRTSQGAREEFYPHYSHYLSLHPSFAGGMPRHVYDQWIANGLLVGSPQQIIDGIMTHRELLGVDRFVGQFDPGMPESLADGSLELYLTEVLPVIKAETRTSEPAATEVAS
ncbi:alkanesulfonate monooxygenase SsuD/methylene tetrahydromethanopterin reductase-like flavin-dependent oxidoreductase (luciferase family) [Promicromonospora sp. AC04]|uniref:LLM class flavin-dependent oxidoreductase n=1 Tax=Promicromonospora sp. AC04 TaxID=2135723 RepID=UPI000D332739|nr:LLM class flavin-dependent oxidoreductase [Promicromonospora sp. AC04]PUB27659.1 alkanesulfonate monooxygenase SsuD/methylene tetrahydromethanopterin reductase-like flavin-dependent oxidoreductase (luciferase family) [Promicromonospora sp. AC04]